MVVTVRRGGTGRSPHVVLSASANSGRMVLSVSEARALQRALSVALGTTNETGGPVPGTYICGDDEESDKLLVNVLAEPGEPRFEEPQS